MNGPGEERFSVPRDVDVPWLQLLYGASDQGRVNHRGPTTWTSRAQGLCRSVERKTMRKREDLGLADSGIGPEEAVGVPSVQAEKHCQKAKSKTKMIKRQL